MTCIIGLAHEGTVYIGADSASGTDGTWEVRATKVPKVFRLGDFLIGYTTSFRMGQILHYHLEVRPQESEGDNLSYMVRVFIPAVRACLKEHGFSKIENNQEEGGFFLVGYRGRLYSIASDFQVNEMADGLDALGCGREYALGAMMAFESEGIPPPERIFRSLAIAACFSGGVIGPFRVLQMPHEGRK